MSDASMPNRRLTRLEVLAVMEEHFQFPGRFPLTVIARSGTASRARCWPWIIE